MNRSKHLILNHNTHESQQTHEPQILRNELQLKKKMIKITKMLFDGFAYEKFICADSRTEYVSKSIIILK